MRATGADTGWKAAGTNASAALTAARRSTVRMAPISEQMSASRRWSRSLEGQAMCRPVLQPSNSRGTDSFRTFKVQQFTKLVPKAHATSRKIQCTSADSADIFGCAGTEWSPSIAAVIWRSLPLTPICMPGITTHYLRRQDNARSASLDLSLSTSSKDDSDGSNRARCATSPTRAKFGEGTSGWKGLLGASLPGRSTWKNALRFAEAVESKKRFQK